ncbi:VOC family protein [Aliisedimentitalea scapharcae]|uniref:VOC family protein n=1 Tax=Aliisedimentitalea scapharcae TaxID=1524259 RepID=A0ABZ2XS86_9RHOB
MPAISNITGLFETHLPVADLDRSIQFYRDRIGLQLARVVPDRNVAFLWVAGPEQGMLGLWGGQAGPLRMTLHFAFRLALSELVDLPDRLGARGIQPLGFHAEPVVEPVVIGWMPAASVYCKDPDGHSLEFLSPLRDPADDDFGIGPLSHWRARHR